MFLLRFDMRAPTGGANTISQLYSSAIEMATWGEQNGCLATVISQHHSSSDNYLPSPLILASAIAAKTDKLAINIGALLLNMYDPIKLAEDIAVLDIISNGRVSYTIGLGYRAEEYAMFGIPMKARGKIMEEKLSALISALRGERFEYHGRQVHVTPTPPSGKNLGLNYGGHSNAAAKRAGKFGLGLIADGGGPELEKVYRDAAAAHSQEAGMVYIPPANLITSLHVAKDVDKAWQEMGPHLLHDAQMYGDWMANNTTAATSYASSVDELRAEQGPYRIVTPEDAVAMIKAGQILAMQPLCGGMPIALAWRSLQLVADEVMPEI
jgi:alkanesulfonate monooxygenase SsuD/methylene tetrahydromethanopterin reductase-like flavin-dependent oxidoreductase (luciferase family)